MIKPSAIHFVHQPAEGQTKAVLCLVHGIGEHSGRYEHCFSYFSKHQLAATAIDLPGHGKSEGRRGDISSFDDFFQAIDVLYEQCNKLYPQQPKILYGHSMGGLIVLAYLLGRKPEWVSKSVVTSPWLDLSTPPAKGLVAFAKLMDKVFPHLVLKSGLNTQHISREQHVVDAYKNDSLVHDRVSVRLFVDALRQVNVVKQTIGSLRVPLFLAHGTADKICSFEASKNLAEKNPQHIQFRAFNDCYHEIHNESNQEQLFGAILQFISI